MRWRHTFRVTLTTEHVLISLRRQTRDFRGFAHVLVILPNVVAKALGGLQRYGYRFRTDREKLVLHRFIAHRLDQRLLQGDDNVGWRSRGREDADVAGGGEILQPGFDQGRGLRRLWRTVGRGDRDNAQLA